MVRRNLSAWQIFLHVRQEEGEENAPPVFFADKKVVGSYEECALAMCHSEINDSIDRIHALKQKRMTISPSDIDAVDSIVLGAYLQVFPDSYF